MDFLIFILCMILAAVIVVLAYRTAFIIPDEIEDLKDEIEDLKKEIKACQ